MYNKLTIKLNKCHKALYTKIISANPVPLRKHKYHSSDICTFRSLLSLSFDDCLGKQL